MRTLFKALGDVHSDQETNPNCGKTAYSITIVISIIRRLTVPRRLTHCCGSLIHRKPIAGYQCGGGQHHGTGETHCNAAQVAQAVWGAGSGWDCEERFLRCCALKLNLHQSYIKRLQIC